MNPDTVINEVVDKYNKSLYIKCDCSAHMLQVERHIDIYDNDQSKEFYFSIWELGRRKDKLTWKEKFRWCWHIIKTGDPWADSVMITDENAIEISNFIQSQINLK